MSLLIKIQFYLRSGLCQLPDLQAPREILFFLFSMESSGLSLYYNIGLRVGFIVICTVPINLPFLLSHANVDTFTILCHLQLYLFVFLTFPGIARFPEEGNVRL